MAGSAFREEERTTLEDFLWLRVSVKTFAKARTTSFFHFST